LSGTLFNDTRSNTEAVFKEVAAYFNIPDI